jgi:hypothetical protein
MTDRQALLHQTFKQRDVEAVEERARALILDRESIVVDARPAVYQVSGV